MCTLHRGGSVLLPPVEEPDTISRQRKKCLLYTEERSPDALCRGERTPSLYREEGASFLHQAQSVPLLYVEEADSFSVQGSIVFSTHPRECPSAMCRGGLLFIRSIKCLLYTEARVSLLLLYAMGRVSSPHGGEIVLLLYVKEADSFSVQRRECLL